MRRIRQATADDFVDGYPHLDLATRSMLARRANLGRGTTVAALQARQNEADIAANSRAMRPHMGRHTWNDTLARSLEEALAAKRAKRVASRGTDPTNCLNSLCQPAPHDKNMQELQGWTIDHREFGDSIGHYIAGNTNHPLVQKFGWVKTTAIKH